MKTLFDESLRNAMLARIRSVTPEAKPTWGKMNAEKMLAHLVQSMRMGVGELDLKPMKMPLRYTPLRQLIVYVLPFPKGVRTLPELMPSNPVALEESKRELARLFDDFGRRSAQQRWPEHPAFGPIGRRGWGVLSWRHLDHHLRQFGV
jgi:hypothetical protein